VKNVSILFVGNNSDQTALKFYDWLVNGGLEDSIIQNLSDDKTIVEGIIDTDSANLTVAMSTAINENDSKQLINDANIFTGTSKAMSIGEAIENAISKVSDTADEVIEIRLNEVTYKKGGVAGEFNDLTVKFVTI